MSIMNVWIDRDRALVAVDTQALSQVDGKFRDASKLLALPHANAVLAARGEIVYFGWVFNGLQTSGAADYDAMVQAMPELLAQNERLFRGFQKSYGVETFNGYEIALVGWSAAIGRMLGVRYEKWPGDPHVRATAIDPWSLSPNAGWERVPKLPEELEQASRDQVAMLRTLPCVAAGGRLIVAEVTRNAVNVQTVCELG